MRRGHPARRGADRARRGDALAAALAPRRPARGGQRRRPAPPRRRAARAARAARRHASARRTCARRSRCSPSCAARSAARRRDPARRPRRRASRRSWRSPSCSSWRPRASRRSSSTDGRVEYAVYGAPGELPALPDLARRRRRGAGRGLDQRGRRRLAGALDASSTVRCWSTPPAGARRAGAARAPAVGAAPRRAGGADAIELVIDPGQAFGTGAHATHPAVPRAAARARAPPSAPGGRARRRHRLGRARDRRGAMLGYAPRARARQRGGERRALPPRTRTSTAWRSRSGASTCAASRCRGSAREPGRRSAP